MLFVLPMLIKGQFLQEGFLKTLFSGIYLHIAHYRIMHTLRKLCDCYGSMCVSPSGLDIPEGD